MLIRMLLAFSSLAVYVLVYVLVSPICTLIPGNQQRSSIWKRGKEGGKCNFLLFNDK